MRNTRAQQNSATAPYRAAFRLSSAVLESSNIPDRYRWSDDRIRTDLIEQDRRRERASWVRSLCKRGWGRVKATLGHSGQRQGATNTSVPG